MEGTGPALVFSAAGALVVAVSWLVVRAGWTSVWSGMGAVLGVLGIVSLASERVVASGRLQMVTALLVGAIAGISLYLGTHVFMRLASRWEPLGRHTDDLYKHQEEHTLARSLFATTFVIVPGEELFWRGMVQGALAATIGAPAGAVAAWVAYVLANLASGSVPVMLAAAVGGLLWAALTLATGGIVASLVCHAVWTGLMIAHRPG